jgi:4'-phosphopantetheinyl transferase
MTRSVLQDMTPSVLFRRLDDPAWAEARPGKYPLYGCAHIWRVPLAATPQVILETDALLEEEERQKASRFRQVADRHRYLLGHGMIRKIAVAYFGMSLHELSLGWDTQGKPFFRGPLSTGLLSAGPLTTGPSVTGPSTAWGRPDLHFNISHAGDWILLAFAASPVGIDVEEIKEGVFEDAFLHRVFTPTEVGAMIADQAGPDSFFLHWTRKEALSKTTSPSILDNPHRIPCIDGTHALPAPEGGFGSVSGFSGVSGFNGVSGFGSSWVVNSFPVADSHIASFAHSNDIESLNFWDLTP